MPTATISDGFNRADGAIGSTDTGQPWVQVGAGGPAVLGVISGNKLIATVSGQAHTSCYNGLDLGEGHTPSRMAAQVSFGTGPADGGVVALISNKQGLTSVGHITAGSVHILFTDTHVDVAVFRGPTDYAILNAYTYLTPCARDGVTQYTVAWTRDGDTLSVLMPDGTTQIYTEPEYGSLVGRYCTFEHYFNAANATPAFYAVSIEYVSEVPDGPQPVSPSERSGMNRLCRLSKVKGDLAGVGSATTVDATYLRQMDEASAEFVRSCGREFTATLATRYFRGGESGDSRRLYTGDIASLTTVKVDADQDGVYETTLVVNTDFWLGSDEQRPGWPARELYLMPNGQLGAWPLHRRAVQVVALFGFSYELEAVVVSGSPAVGTLTSTTDLTCAITGDATSVIDPGDTIVMGSEQMDVASVAFATGTTTVTLTARGINGTTAAIQTAVPIFIRRYPRDIERVVAERVVSGRWDNQGGYQMADGGTPGRAIYARWCDAVSDYTNPSGLF
jgi:hypothetical protein